ncbi:MAG TPA: hypothetical protein VG095_02400, partial [Chthoniobacterales bacterium]|nr:hypothetical protein [Chthoniobacterales bacterium]
VQQQITADLERQRVRIAVLAKGGIRDEPNESSKPGAVWLDEYLAANYEQVGENHRFVFLRRRVASGLIEEMAVNEGTTRP